MWYKQLPSNYLHCRSGMINLNGLWHDGNVYVMDNHRAAAWCWLQACDKSAEYSFLHIDYHSDLLLDGCAGVWDTYKKTIATPGLSLEEYLDIRHTGSNNAIAFRWDNYIRPIHGLLPNWFKPAYFAYYQDFDIEDYDKKCTSGAYSGFSGTANRITANELLDLLSQISLCQTNKWIINLDIDFFFSKQIVACQDSYIEAVGRLLNDCLPQTQVLTIALSPSCCKGRSIIGGWRNAIRVLGLLKQHLPALSTLTIPF